MLPAIFLMGPTTAGKTDLALHLVERLPLEIVNVDSAQVYRGMDIGTAKPRPEILAHTPHRLIDIRDPEVSYSAAEFRADALAAMGEIHAVGRVPLLVGGTGLYFRALRYGLSDLPAADPTLRARLEYEGHTLGWQTMHRRLAEVDAKAAARIHPNDPQRIQRALEVWELTGQPISAQQQQTREPILPYRVLTLIRAPQDREGLRMRIAARFHDMLEQGFEQEVQSLLARSGVSPETPSLRSVGYRQMVHYLLRKTDWPGMVEQGILATRHLAKRQMTWLRSERDARWLYDEDGHIEETAERWVCDWIADDSVACGQF